VAHEQGKGKRRWGLNVHLSVGECPVWEMVGDHDRGELESGDNDFVEHWKSVSSSYEV
jgi:hypothetical protein